MSRTSRYLFFIGIVIALPIAGYAVAHLVTVGFPLSDLGTPARTLFVLAMIFGLLAIPYWMLKLTARAAHEMNPEEKELTLKDIPKEKKGV